MSSSFRKALSGVRFGAGARVKGRWVEGVPEIIHITASVQPISEHDLLFLEIGRRERKAYTLFTDDKLNCLTADHEHNPDCIDIDNERYEVVVEAPWRNNVISHYKYIVSLMQAIEG
jgi:hypothetical protein